MTRLSFFKTVFAAILPIQPNNGGTGESGDRGTSEYDSPRISYSEIGSAPTGKIVLQERLSIDSVSHLCSMSLDGKHTLMLEGTKDKNGEPNTAESILIKILTAQAADLESVIRDQQSLIDHWNDLPPLVAKEPMSELWI